MFLLLISLFAFAIAQTPQHPKIPSTFQSKVAASITGL